MRTGGESKYIVSFILYLFSILGFTTLGWLFLVAHGSERSYGCCKIQDVHNPHGQTFVSGVLRKARLHERCRGSVQLTQVALVEG